MKVQNLLILLTLSLFTAVISASEAELKQIFADEWQHRLNRNPVFAISMDPTISVDSLADISEPALKEQADFHQQIIKRLEKLDYQSLSKEAQINFRIFKAQMEDNIAQYKYKAYQIPFNTDSSFYSSFARLPKQLPFDTKNHYQNYLNLLGSWPKRVEQQIQHMQDGLQSGMTQPRELLSNIPGSIKPYLSEGKIEDNSFYVPFTKIPAHFDQKTLTELTQQAKSVIGEQVIPAYQKLADFMNKEYLTKARTTLGATDLPNGKDYYAQRVKHFTTSNYTVDEIHQIGLSEVKRIRSEMQEVIDKLEFEGDFKAFIEFLRTDPQFYAKTAEDLLKQASWIAKRMDAKLPSLFKTLPRLPYGVEAVPAAIAPTYTTGRYVSAPAGSTEPGYYWVNTYALDKRPLYVLEALTLHEAVPGHHLQIALNNEKGNLPFFRQYSYISAFGEGWGLYAEWLGLEAGFYQDPYSNFGRLTYEMWRAVRLVVDTGVHAKGWSRQKARNFLADNTALSLHNVYTEIDRYISWPGQALSYKMGEIHIKNLRKKAEKALGSKFDVRDFHEAVLSQGSVPMDVLTDQIETYIKKQKAQ